MYMQNKTVERVFLNGGHLPMSVKMTLLAIAHHADDTNRASPGIERIAQFCEAGGKPPHKTTIQRHIKKLEESGDLIVNRNVGRGNQNEYWIVTGLSDEEKAALKGSVIVQPFNGEKVAKKGSIDEIKGSKSPPEKVANSEKKVAFSQEKVAKNDEKVASKVLPEVGSNEDLKDKGSLSVTLDPLTAAISETYDLTVGVVQDILPFYADLYMTAETFKAFVKDWTSKTDRDGHNLALPNFIANIEGFKRHYRKWQRGDRQPRFTIHKSTRSAIPQFPTQPPRSYERDHEIARLRGRLGGVS